MAIGSEIPANAGCYEPVKIVAPDGLCVTARSPAPVANRMAIAHRVVNAVMGAFAKAVPGRVPAAYYGVSYAYATNLFHADGRRQVYFDLTCGGWGGHPEGDGANGFSCGLHNIANAPIEMLESTYPVTFQAYHLVPNLGGAGELARRLRSRLGRFGSTRRRGHLRATSIASRHGPTASKEASPVHPVSPSCSGRTGRSSACRRRLPACRSAVATCSAW